MLQKAMILSAAALMLAAPACAEDIDSLRGQFTFDWHQEPGKTRCKAVDDKLLALFKSDKFTCALEPVTNTASEEPARTCTEKDERAEYLIFATEKACESERQAQEANAE